jgi:hypothetical protein
MERQQQRGSRRHDATSRGDHAPGPTVPAASPARHPDLTDARPTPHDTSASTKAKADAGIADSLGLSTLPVTTISYYASGVESIKGTPVTEQDVQGWADEAERGYDVEQLRKRGRKPIGDGPAQVVPVRIDATLLAALTERAERDHVSRSEAIRAAIRSYVA